MVKVSAVAAACIAGVLAALPSRGAMADDLIILTNQGATPGVRELATAFSRMTGHNVSVIQEAGADLDRRLSTGPADLISGNPEQIEDLVKKGRVVAGTAVPYALASLGVSVRAGLPKPDISTPVAYRAALLAARSIGYSRGCSGTHAAQGIAELGLTEQLKSKTVFTDSGPVVEFLAKGDFDLGIQQTNIMVGAPGTEYVGTPPGDLNKPCPSSVALLPISQHPDAARTMMRFMTSPQAAPLLRKTLVEPAKR